MKIFLLILMECITVGFIVISTLLGGSIFYCMVTILYIVTVAEFMKTYKQAWVGLIYPGLFVLTLPFIFNLPSGPSYLLYLFFIVEVNDTAAYIIGKLIGKKHPFPTLSPGKTVAGLYSGFLVSFPLSLWLGITFLNVYPPILILLILITLIVGVLGDLVASYFKRRSYTKDFSSLIPTQGGMLDAYDAFLFAAPFYYAMLLILSRCRVI